MRLDWALLAEAVQIREGLAFILGGGVDTVNANQLPVQLNVAVLVRLLLHRTETDIHHVVEIRLLDEDGGQLAQMHRHLHARPAADLPPGWDVPLMATFEITNLPLVRAALYSVEILGDGGHLKSLNLKVRLTQPEPAPA